MILIFYIKNFLYNILLEVNEDYLDHIKNEEEAIIEKILKNKMEAYFNTIFEDV